MKKHKKSSFLLAIIFVMTIAITACTYTSPFKDLHIENSPSVFLAVTACISPPDGLAGNKFFLDSMQMSGMTISVSDLEASGQIERETLYLEFKRDEKVIISVDDEAIQGTYTLSDKNLTLIGDGEEIKGTVEGDKIIITEDEGNEAVSIVFKKD
ncbi:hypothetical protein [Anaerosporobacter sp.]|uniref:hypothetical protein n=1 Tax=Anaerosporobacter sp. TaxID=1872529 RepID=UPI00286EE98F|nr:hypothetical protein [Anaerosporobacter sp.]